MVDNVQERSIRREGERRLVVKSVDKTYLRRASVAIDVLFQGKWKAQILFAMRSGPVRLGQLARIIPGASKKMLTQNLRKLEADGIVVRRDLTDLVLHVEYDLNDEIRAAIYDLLDQVARWGDIYRETLGGKSP